MSCGCANNYLGNKVLNLETMKNMSIDEITNLYRQGYKLEESSRHVSQDISGLQMAPSGNIQSLTIRSYPNIIDGAAYWNGSSTFPMLLYGNSGMNNTYVHLEAYLSPNTVISNIRECANIMIALYRLAVFPAVSGAINNIMFRAKGCDSTATETCTTCTGGAGEYITGNWTNGASPGAVNTTSPPNPTGLTITPGNGELALYWNASTDPATGTEVFAYKVTVTGPNGITGYRQSGTPGRTVTVSGLTNGASYSVSVKSLSYNNVESTGAATGTGTPAVPCVTPVITSVTCPSSPINQGSSGNISAYITAGTGTPPFTYYLYVDGSGPVDTYSNTTSLFHIFTHTFNETIATHTYRVDVMDNCSKSATGNCTATIQAALGTITFNVTSVGSPLSGVAISVNGVPRGTTDGSGTLTVPSLTVGATHTYVATKSGYDTVSSNTVLDTTAKTVPISMTLTSPPTAINIIPNKTSCAPPCNVSVDITWKNNAATDTIFVPSMKIDNITISPVPYPSQTLGPGLSTTKTFTILGLTNGIHTICPDPN